MYKLIRFLTSTSAKDISILYFIYGIFTIIIGSVFSLFIRLELSIPGNHYINTPNYSNIFNMIITSHALIMIFYAIMPLTVGGFGNYLVPIMIGTHDMAKKKEKDFLNDNSFSPLSSYLAGLFEGDGHIWIPQPTSSRKKNPVFAITFHIDDLPLADKLLSLIGGGHIVKRKTKSLELRITRIIDLKKVIELINGKLRTPKIYQLHKLIDWINWHHSLYIKKKPIDLSPINENSWLSGFIDADGSFYIKNSIKSIACKFALEQRMICPKTNESYGAVLERIAIFLDISLNIRKRETRDDYYILRVENQAAVKNLINYLNKFPLFGKKYLNYLNWEKAFNIILEKNQYSKENREKILELKNTMNDKREYFNWDHLKNLF